MTSKKLLAHAHDFSCYGILAERAAEIRSHFNTIWHLIDTGKRNTSEFEIACVARDSSVSRLFDLITKHGEGLSYSKTLQYSLKHSAEYGLRCPHLVADVFHTYRNNVEGATQVGNLLHNCEITRFTTDGGWSNFDETIEGLLRSGWVICGLHNLPARYAYDIARNSRAIVFQPGQASDWID